MPSATYMFFHNFFIWNAQHFGWEWEKLNIQAQDDYIPYKNFHYPKIKCHSTGLYAFFTYFPVDTQLFKKNMPL